MRSYGGISQSRAVRLFEAHTNFFGYYDVS
jgi:hypothetical protein